MASFTDFIASKKYVILSGAMGTELQRRGYETRLPLWSAQANLDAPELVRQIHEDYIKAGTDLLTTNTFRTQPYTFQKVRRRPLASEATKNAVQAILRAKKSADRDVFAGGELAPLEDCYLPDLIPEDSILEEEHFSQAKLLASLGVDFLFCETINSIREALIMIRAAKSTGLPFMISFLVNPQGDLLNGESLKKVIDRVAVFHPVGILLNCRPIDIINQGIDSLCRYYSGVKGVYPNGIGKPADDLGWTFSGEGDNIVKFVEFCERWYKQGVKILGGCCGTTPEYIKALSKRMAML
ncbi:homocysteine S-methyltransferase family protein [Candidatus Peregrinibacteria bacterium]|nr:homocysteine S-methyltransferase family protein [Candidatus Peregrinibacteria bacterium]